MRFFGNGRFFSTVEHIVAHSGKNDKTVISYENVDLKENLEAIRHEKTQFFEQKGSLNDFAEFFSRWIKTQAKQLLE